MFEKTYFVALLTSLLRHFLTGAGVWFVTNNIGTQGQWEELLAGVAALLVSGGLLLYSKSQISKKIDAARLLPSTATNDQINEKASEL